MFCVLPCAVRPKYGFISLPRSRAHFFSAPIEVVTSLLFLSPLQIIFLVEVLPELVAADLFALLVDVNRRGIHIRNRIALGVIALDGIGFVAFVTERVQDFLNILAVLDQTTLHEFKAIRESFLERAACVQRLLAFLLL